MSELDGTELVHWRELPPAQRRGWWEQVWEGAITLSARYRLALRTGWWEDSLQVEAIAAFYAWLRLYDTGAYTDPPGKLQLVWELERLRAVLRAGEKAFDPAADRASFERHVESIEHPTTPQTGGAADVHTSAAAAQLSAELASVSQRLVELRERRGVLHGEHAAAPRRRGRADDQAEHDAAQLDEAIRQLSRREHELTLQLDRQSSVRPG